MLGGSDLTDKVYTRLEKLGGDKHSSLFGLFNSDNGNKLNNTDYGGLYQNTFYSFDYFCTEVS